ncbi:MAG: MMPL family transporter [Candidatus Hydrogenedentes bacterium]|nr:MMPL family transporter [Candidatus Hydrogenedentota bacterium]
MATVLLTALLSFQIRNAVFNADYRVFFNADDPAVRAYGQVLAEYTDEASVFYVVTAKQGDVFEPRVLEAVAYLTEQGWGIPGVVRVDSITNFQHARWEDGKFRVSNLIGNPASATAEELATAKRIAVTEPLLVDRIINRGATVTGVNVQVGGREVDQVSAAMQLKARAEDLYPEIEIRMTGVVMLNDGFKTATIKDVLTMTPIIAIILVATMIVLLRSFSLTLATFFLIAMSVGSAMGVAVLLDYEISGPVAPSPIMIMTLAVANCVHIFVTLLWQLRHGLSKDEAVVETMRLNLSPIFVTSTTTAIGFLSMTLNAVPPMQVMAIVTALGVLFSFLYSCTFIPALVSILPIHTRLVEEKPGTRTLIMRIGDWVILRYKPLIPICIVITALLASFVPTIEFNNQYVNFLKESQAIRRDTDYAAEHLTGIFQVTYSFRADGPGGVCDPEYLARLDAFDTWMLKQEGVTHVQGLATTVKRLNRLIHRGDTDFARIPETREAATTALKLYERALPKGLTLRSQINEDWSAARTIVTTSNLRSEEIDRLAHDAALWMEANMPEHQRSDSLGPWVMFAEISKIMLRGMIIGAPLALTLVSIVLIFALRSLRFGLLSLVPNLLPLVAALGFWGMLGLDLDLAMSGVMAMGIGIIVDDTVHFMSKYLRARREQHLDPKEAVRYAYASVGKALVITSFVLGAGFMTLIFSIFTTTVNMGLLTTLVIAFALAGDLLFLPPLLIAFDRKGNK